MLVVPKPCTEAHWGCQSDVSVVLWDIFNFQRRYSGICRSLGKLLAQGRSLLTLDVATFLLVTSLLCEAGVWAVTLIKSKY